MQNRTFMWERVIISFQSSVIISLLSSCFGPQSKCTISYLVFQLSNSNIFDSTGDWFLISSFRGDWSLRELLNTIEYTGTVDYYWIHRSYWFLRSYWLLLITVDYCWLLLKTICKKSKLFAKSTNATLHPLKTSPTKMFFGYGSTEVHFQN